MIAQYFIFIIFSSFFYAVDTVFKEKRDREREKYILVCE